MPAKGLPPLVAATSGRITSTLKMLERPAPCLQRRATPSVHSWKLHSMAGRKIPKKGQGLRERRSCDPLSSANIPKTFRLASSGYVICKQIFFHFHWGCCGSYPRTPFAAASSCCLFAANTPSAGLDPRFNHRTFAEKKFFSNSAEKEGSSMNAGRGGD